MKRNEAKQLGIKTYDNGKPCKHCNNTLRYVSSAGCVTCTISNTNQDYIKEYSKNSEKAARSRERRYVKYQEDGTFQRNQSRYSSKPESLQKRKDYYESNKLNIRSKDLQKKYGISIEEYNDMFEKQDYACKICSKEYEIGKYFAVDHCHETGKIRGILCQGCNIGIGLFKDNIELLENAVRYIRCG